METSTQSVVLLTSRKTTGAPDEGQGNSLSFHPRPSSKRAKRTRAVSRPRVSTESTQWHREVHVQAGADAGVHGDVAGVDEDEGPAPPRFSGGRAWRRTCRSASVTGRATAREREPRSSTGSSR